MVSGLIEEILLEYLITVRPLTLLCRVTEGHPKGEFNQPFI